MYSITLGRADDWTATLTGHDEGDVAVAVGVHGHVAALEGGPAIRDKS